MTDSSYQGLLNIIDKQGQAFDAYKQTNDERYEAEKDGREADAKHLGEKLDKINEDLTKYSDQKTQIEREMKFQRERIEELEVSAKRPKRTIEQKISDDYTLAFEKWIRSGATDRDAESEMKRLSEKARLEAKTLTIGVQAEGGFAVPEQIAREINNLELKFSPVRSLVKVVTISTSDYKELVNIRGAGAAWAGESTDRTVGGAGTATPQLRERTPTHGELFAYPQASKWLFEDAFFNVGQWLANEVADAFAIQEGSAVISGDGVSKPTGMLNTTPLATADFASPLRNANAYEFVASNASPAAAGIIDDTLIDLVYRLNSRYRANATWIMNSFTTGEVRKLKDLQGRYLWAPGLAAGEPDRLLGYPVSTWEQMPDIAANAFPIAFGDWRRAYTLVDRVGMQIILDQITRPGFLRWYISRREGGIVTNNDAAKFLRTI